MRHKSGCDRELNAMLLLRSTAIIYALNLPIGSADAGVPVFGGATDPSLKTVGSLSEGGFTAPPQAFFQFCTRFVRQCVRSGGSKPVALVEERWSELSEVNAGVNRRIKPRAEPPGVDIWTLGAREGDCDAFAIEKRKELIDLGWPSSALNLTVVYARSSEAHLVLTVRTDHGEFVLDNLRSEVLGVESVGYTFVMRQSAMHPRLWVSIDRVKAGSMIVANVNRSGFGRQYSARE